MGFSMANYSSHALRCAFSVALFFSTHLVQADPVYPTSYDTLNGSFGSFTYFDDTYNGVGATNVPFSPLTGGLGDLTDGIIAISSYDVTNIPYVGWSSDIAMTFHFASTVPFQSVTVYYDDPNSGGVVPPSSVTINGQVYPVSNPPANVPFAETYDITGTQSDTLLMFFDSVPGTWQMISEIQFEAVPEPACVGMALLGIATVSIAVYRRQQRR
jgi:hypothetical protein